MCWCEKKYLRIVFHLPKQHVMLALLGLALSQAGGGDPCPNGRLVKEVPIPRYAPWCCAGESYVHFEDLEASLIEEMKGKFVTVAPQTDTSLEFPTSKA